MLIEKTTFVTTLNTSYVLCLLAWYNSVNSANSVKIIQIGKTQLSPIVSISFLLPVPFLFPFPSRSVKVSFNPIELWSIAIHYGRPLTNNNTFYMSIVLRIALRYVLSRICAIILPNGIKIGFNSSGDMRKIIHCNVKKCMNLD